MAPFQPLSLLTAAALPLQAFATTIGPVGHPNTFTVKLDMQHVPVVVNNRTVMNKTAYFGTVYVGIPPQSFTVVYDTGSGHFFLPSATCMDEPCRTHRTFDDRESASSVRINYDGSQVDDAEPDRDQVSISYGTGRIIGAFVQEIVCAGAPAAAASTDKNAESGWHSQAPDVLPAHCTWVRTVLARNMTSEPFQHFQFDGVLGLGLGALALEPEYHFFGQLVQDQPMDPVFSVFLAKEDHVQSEITFGGHDTSKARGALQWVPVLSPEQGYWRVGIRRVRVGDEVLSFCEDGDCSAILDTGTSMLGVPTRSIQALIMMTARTAPSIGSMGSRDCLDMPGPPLIFDIGDDGFSVELHAEDYSQPAPVEIPGNDTAASQYMCRASLLPVEMPPLGPKVFLWGKPVLQRYYTAYDSRRERVGFSPCVQPGAAEANDIGADAPTMVDRSESQQAPMLRGSVVV